MKIEGGTGNGYLAKVSKENKLEVSSVTASVEHHTNHKHGTAFNMLFSATPTGAGDCFLYVKNTSEEDMCIEGFTLHLVASEYIEFKLGDSGTATGGSTVTPANLNSSSGNIATGTFENGNDITGLSGGTTVDRIYHATSAGSTSYNFEQDIILPKNGVFTMYCETGTTAINGVINFNYHSGDI